MLDADPGSKVSVEVLDDVAVETETGDVDAVQLKTALKTNPISNRSLDLWTTISNWLNAVKSGELKVEKTTFSLRLGRFRTGAICKSFSDAVTTEAADNALKKAKNEFFAAKGDKLKKGISTEFGEIVKEIFKPSHLESLRSIIVRFRLSFGNQYAYEELLGRLKTKFIDEEIAEDVLLHALGWVKKEIDGAVEKDQQPSIDVDEFRVEINAFRDRLKGRSYLPSFAGPPSLAEIELHKLRLFVRQLNLIEGSEDQILGAIADFLSARTNRIEYARRGHIHAASFDEFEQALKSLWSNHRAEVELDQSEKEITRGQRLALRCLRERLRLQGIEVPADFTPGCLHSLADVPSIGWHPRYENLLNRE